MDPRSWLRHSVQIARTERKRSRRQLDRSSVLRAVIAVGLIAISIGSGLTAYSIGIALYHGQATLPLDVIQVAATAGFLMLLFTFLQRASEITERIDTYHLLTTVSARAVALGVVLAASSRVAIRISLAAVGVAVGFALGTRSPASALTIVVAVAGFFALTALIGVGLSLAVELVTTRSPRVRRYKNVFIVIAFVLAFIGWTAASAELVSVEFLIEWLGIVPTAWFVDLGLLGASGVQSELPRSLGALGLLVGGIPVLTVVTTALATRVWETEPVSAATLHRSRSLVGAGIAERLFAGRVSRPVLTVARKRWLQERRVPLGLMMAAGYGWIIPLALAFIALAAGGMAIILVIAFACATGTGLAFGTGVLGSEYTGLPMALTSVAGRQFIRGTIFAGIVIGAPITAIILLVLGLMSPLGIIETVLVAIVGVVLCVCSVAVAVAIGMDAPYRDLWPVPVPFTSITAYSELGRMSFIRPGAMLALVGLVCLPAFVGYLSVFFDPVAMALGISPGVVRVGTLVLTTVLAVGVSILAYRRAVRLYDQYTLS